jgi:hypothetical protein
VTGIELSRDPLGVVMVADHRFAARPEITAVTFLPGKQKRALEFTSAVWRPVTDLGVEISEVVMWRAEDTDSPLLRPLITIAGQLRTRTADRAPDQGTASRAAS